MDVLTATEMPDRCNDAPKDPKTYGSVWMPPTSPQHMRNIWYRGNIQVNRGILKGIWMHGGYGCTGAYGHTRGHTDVQGMQMPPMLTTPTCLPLM